MSVALHGSLRDFGIGEVFQLIGQQRKTGVLEIEDAGRRIEIVFQNGAVVKAETAGPYEGAALGDMLVRVGLLTPDRLLEIENALEQGKADFADLLVQRAGLRPAPVEEIVDLVTRDTIFALLRWTRGSFHFTAQPVASSRHPSKLLPAEQILMDGLRMVDEWRTLEDAATRDDTVFQRVGRFETVRAAHPDDPPERLAAGERLFLQIDGRLPARRVIDLSRLGTFEGARVLSGLLRLGVIEVVDEEALARRRRRRASVPLPPMRDSSVPQVLAALLPFAFLLGMAWLALGAGEAPPPRGVLETDPAREARTAFETRRLRNQLEAFGVARGRWPVTLEELAGLSGDALLPAGPDAGPLAARKDAPYYYASRKESVLLLAPEP